MIDPRFVYLAAALSVYGVAGYLRDTWRGTTAPHRVSWGLWAVVGLLGFVDELQQHVGQAAVMTLFYGLIPTMVVVASFLNPRSVWRVGPFDVFCGALSIVGIVAWAVVHQSTVALVAFVLADQVAGLPTLRKSWIAPESESPKVFALGVLNSAITLATLTRWTTAGALFPATIMVFDAAVAVLVAGRLGPRWRGSRGSLPRVA